jgi:hypothetical protein
MSDAQKLAEAKAYTRRAQRDAFTAQIRLAVITDKLAAAETIEAKRQKVLVQSAVERMVKAGALRPDDHAGQFDMTAQLLSDPSGLIPLALTKQFYRAGTTKNEGNK